MPCAGVEKFPQPAGGIRLLPLANVLARLCHRQTLLRKHRHDVSSEEDHQRFLLPWARGCDLNSAALTRYEHEYPVHYVSTYSRVGVHCQY